MEPDFAKIGSRIQRIRKESKKTQEQMAEFLDVSVSYVSQMERGITKISLTSLYRIAEYLECDVNCFLNHFKPKNTAEPADKIPLVKEKQGYKTDVMENIPYISSLIKSCLPPKSILDGDDINTIFHLVQNLNKREMRLLCYYISCYLKTKN